MRLEILSKFRRHHRSGGNQLFCYLQYELLGFESGVTIHIDGKEATLIYPKSLPNPLMKALFLSSLILALTKTQNSKYFFQKKQALSREVDADIGCSPCCVILFISALCISISIIITLCIHVCCMMINASLISDILQFEVTENINDTVIIL